MNFKFPKHYTLNIEHNPHKGYYETIDDYEKKRIENGDFDINELKICKEKDELWTIQLYPITPISFYWAAGSTFEKAYEALKEKMVKGSDWIMED